MEEASQKTARQLRILAGFGSGGVLANQQPLRYNNEREREKETKRKKKKTRGSKCAILNKYGVLTPSNEERNDSTDFYTRTTSIAYDTTIARGSDG